MDWQKKEMLMFVHFGIKTFFPSDNHMGDGAEDPKKFNPKLFDARQWVKAAKAGEIIKKHQPNALVYDSGTLVEYMPESCARFPGSHGGVKDPNWSFADDNKSYWYPSEASLIAQGNWFYNNTPIISLNIFKDYYRSTVGLNAVALINVAPNPDGLIDTASVTRPTDDSIITASIEIDLGKPMDIKGVILQEYIPLGQRVSSYTVECFDGIQWVQMASGSTIGYKKLILGKSLETNGKEFPKAERVRLVITDSRASPVINTFSVIGASGAVQK